jgi:uncharacterized glyoxalase superfamily protein PhnB
MEAAEMISRLGVACVLVRNQEEALRFYTEQLGFEKRTDITKDGYRWLTVAPPEQRELEIVLHKADTEESLRQVGKQDFYVLYTDDCHKEYESLRARGVEFTRAPQDQPWGVDAGFLDLYGNEYNLVERAGRKDGPL